MTPTGVRIELVSDPDRTPYRGIYTGRPVLRLIISIAPRGMLRCEVMVHVDDVTVSVCGQRGCTSVSGIDAVFVVERQPPAWRFLTWFGVFARRRGERDRLLLETPDGRVARFVERMIEQRLGLRDESVRGEVRVG